MKNQKGFIQIPVLIGIVVSGILVLVLTLVTYKSVQNNNQTQQLITKQQQELFDAQQAIRNLAETASSSAALAKKESIKAQESLNIAKQAKDTATEAQKQATAAKDEAAKSQSYASTTKDDLSKALQSLDNQTPNSNLSSTEIQQIISGVVSVACAGNKDATIISMGSGSSVKYYNVPGTQILTNAHVVIPTDGSKPSCVVKFSELPQGIPHYTYNTEIYSYKYTDTIDWTLLRLTDPVSPEDALVEIPLIGRYLRQCAFADANIGDEVTIFGYPAVGGNNITVSKGSISGFSGTNYKISSGLIDHGNSGGLAVLNKNKCELGVPTWVSIGEASSVGIIQSWKTIYGDSAK